MTLLITGFGPFDGGSNASEALVNALASDPEQLRQWAGEPVETLILPVDTRAAPRLLEEALARLIPSRLLLTGQAAGRNRIGFESTARNRRSFHVPDIAGELVQDMPVDPDGPELYRATWPELRALADLLNHAGIPAEVSDDCGGHLCNQLLYTVLHKAALQAPGPTAMFLHVPLLPEQVIASEPAAARHRTCAFMPLGMTLDAVKLVLRHTQALADAA